MSDDHERLIAACQKWERLYRAAKVENEVLRTKAEGDLVSRLRDGITAAETDNAALRAALTGLPIVVEALNDLFHVLISEFDRDPMNCVENYLPWPAEKRFALRQAIVAAAAVALGTRTETEQP